MSTDYNGYTQRDWERAVGWGKVPDEYNRVINPHQNFRLTDDEIKKFKVAEEIMEEDKDILEKLDDRFNDTRQTRL